MTSGLLKPLALFCTQSQSQRYIQSVRNLGDAWRTLAEPANLTGADAQTTLIETTFDLALRLRKEDDGTNYHVSLQLPSLEEAAGEEIKLQAPQQPSSTPSESPRHYSIFADYGTDFIWLNENDPNYSDDNTSVEASDALSDYPPVVFENYDAWVDAYSDNFKRRCEDTQNYSAHVFANAMEEIAWNVAGYLLAWRIALAPHVGSVEYSAGQEKYLLEKGKESEMTIKFLGNQDVLLATGESTE
ncbi:uncharacterized protein ACLA_014350 [Aspergillus clavatus NRRL 1]|uniref:Uncharacterized protein n=1 Tax=Aspergillus clavatus (strain ATCC 1007 / CBS 513.65 / DSM 816 / NCTC 3887 / NRRL 1 / QM 1276 / 107) TaxID=344612 RepID=A1CB80_ASPCL|nr:uncharacterized protein ACLA_014350 [Aspergillus clavatus NRRL 1]EAW12998.1 hypothetical protein ACLA_014350 [Aspergillus clavatus NRRL 1]